jgi:hypothetical protein
MHILIMMIGGAVGAVLTFLLQKNGLSAVVASCLIGLLGAGIGALIPGSTYAYLPAVVFAGTFVGMTALNIGSVPIMIAAGAGAGLLYALTVTTVFPGYGGKLGTVAFISTILVVFALSLFLKK